MHFIQFVIRNPVKVTVGVILAVMFGAMAYFATPVKLTPDVEEPQITVSTTWRGASAHEIEREIVERQEDKLKNVEGLLEMRSSSSDSRSRINLRFAVGTDLEAAAAKVRDKLNQVSSYPENVDEPTLTTVNPNSNAIAWYTLIPIPPKREDLEAFAERNPDVAKVLQPMIDGNRPIDIFVLTKLSKTFPKLKALVKGKNDPFKMRKFAFDRIKSRFENVPGIANSNVYGGRELEFRVVVDPAKLAANHITIADVRIALNAQNKNTSAGDIREGKSIKIVRTIGQYDSPQQVEETVVARRDHAIVRIEDIAEVGIAYNKLSGAVKQRGVDSLAINAQQKPGTNLMKVMGPTMKELDLNADGDISNAELDLARRDYGDSLRIAMVEMNNGILKNQGVYLEEVYDQTEYLKSATKLVKNNIYVGGALAVMVLLLFLRSWRSVLIVGLSIPISVIATFLFIRGFGRSINVISLAGMAFAVGMVVDNAIVVLENIFRHYQAGEDPDLAAEKGAQEVWGAVLASTLTTLAVFIPVLFVQDQAGQLFRDIAIAISCAVGLSLIVSVTVIPTAAKRILKKNRRDERSARKEFGWFGLLSFGEKISDSFTKTISKLQTMPGNVPIRIGIVVVFISASVLGAIALTPKTEYLPVGNRNMVMAFLTPPPGYSVEKMIELGEIIEADLAPYWEVEPGSAEEKALGGPHIKNFFFVARGSSLFMGGRTSDPLRGADLVPVITRATEKLPGTIGFVKQASLFESSFSGGRTIDIRFTGPDLETLVKYGAQCMQMVAKQFPREENNQIRPLPSLDLSSPELHIIPDKKLASELGISAEDLGYTINALVDGAYAGDYWHNEERIDLIISGKENYAKHHHDLAMLPIATPSQDLVTLSTLAEIRLSSGPQEIDHSERLRTLTIRLTPAPGIPLEDALETVEEKIRKPLLAEPELQRGDYRIQLTGTADKLDETRRALQWNLVLALVITFLLMAALFESFFYPIVIMTSVILAMVGGLGGLFILNQFTSQSLDMLTMLGFVILIGTVVNNAILIVHQALNNVREHGMDEKLAVVDSVRSRIRPIFMSTTTTVLGMCPLVLPFPSFASGHLVWITGAGSELYRGLGSVILGGLTVSTVFTLILVPIGFSLAIDTKRFLARCFGHASVDVEIPRFQPTGLAAEIVTTHADSGFEHPSASVGGNGNDSGEEADQREAETASEISPVQITKQT